MRDDMFKVIVERPRRGRKYAGKSKLRFDQCKGRNRVTGHRLVTEHNGYTKNLNENLSPLRRYLHRQVGRVWDDVFSEICKKLDTGSTVKMHVREHLDDLINRKVSRQNDTFRHDDVMRDTLLMTTNRRGAPEKLIDSRVDLYVDPDDGRIKETRTLCKKLGVIPIRNRRRGYRKMLDGYGQPFPQHPILMLSETHCHVRLNGLWFKITLTTIPRNKLGYNLDKNSVFECLNDGSWRDQKQWAIAKKKQLSHKALKEHHLKNAKTIYQGGVL